MDEISATLRRAPRRRAHGYFCMLLGDDDTVKPYRMILRFLARLGAATDASGVRAIVRELAEHLTAPERPFTPWMVDHAIWREER